MPYTIGDLAKKVRHEGMHLPNRFLIYGPPGSGKTLLAATICKVSTTKRIIWVDLEDGIATVITANKADGQAYFTEEELSRIEYMPVPDEVLYDAGTTEKLNLRGTEATAGKAARILLPFFRSSAPLHYDAAAQKVVMKPTDTTVSWSLPSLGPEDVLIIDSGSQLAASIFSLAVASNPDHNHGKKHWGEFTNNATAVLSSIQAAKCMVIMICHSMEIEADPDTKRRAKTVPWFGSANFSTKVGHYFGSVIHLYTDTGYRSLSTPITRVTVQGKSRFNIDSAKISSPTMADLLAMTERANKAMTVIRDGESESKPASTPTASESPAKRGPVKAGPVKVKR